MGHSERGTKRQCGTCGAPFYDLNRTPAICPKCHHEYVPVARIPTRAAKGSRMPPPLPIVDEPIPVFDEDEVPGADEESDDPFAATPESEEDQDETRE